MSDDNVHPTVLDFQHQIYALVGAGAPATVSPMANIGSEYTDRSNGNFYKMTSSGWSLLSTATTVAWSSLTGKPTTIAGYGITDAFTQTLADARYLLLSGGSLTGALSATRYTSTIASGTAPLTVASTTAVTNLNADLLDGQHGAYYATASSLGSYLTTGVAASTYLPLAGGILTGVVQAPNFKGMGTAATDDVIYQLVAGDTYARGRIRADGQILWGSGAAAPDTNLYRAAAAALKTDGGFFVGGVLYSGAAATARTAGDINARRSATTGAYYMGDGGNSYLYFDGTVYSFGANGATAPVLAQGSLIASGGQLRATGWNNGNEVAGAGAEVGYASGIAYFIGYDRSNSTYVPVSMTGTYIELLESSQHYVVDLKSTGFTLNSFPIATIQWGSSPPSSSTPGVVGGMYGVT